MSYLGSALWSLHVWVWTAASRESWVSNKVIDLKGGRGEVQGAIGNLAAADVQHLHRLVTVVFSVFCSILKPDGEGGRSEKFCKSIILIQTLKEPYLNNVHPKKALNRCIHILPPQRIFLAMEQDRLISLVCTALFLGLNLDRFMFWVWTAASRESWVSNKFIDLKDTVALNVNHSSLAPLCYDLVFLSKFIFNLNFTAPLARSWIITDHIWSCIIVYDQIWSHMII